MKPTMHLLVYVFCGLVCIAFLVIGYSVHSTYPALSAVLFSIAIALGPVTILGIIYQYFLFQEIRAGAKQACRETMDEKLTELGEAIDHNRRLNELGIMRVYSVRKEAFNEVEDWLAAEDKEIFFVGTSLRGVIGRDEGSPRILEIIRRKVVDKNVSLKFLLTHPVFGPLRQKYESINRKPENSVAREILEAIHSLQNCGVKAESIKFFLGTPTCFGIKTSKYMLLNPYPYQEAALRTLCLVVSKQVGRGEIYNAFDLNHFNGVWGSGNVEDLPGFREAELRRVFDTKMTTLLGDSTVAEGIPDQLEKQIEKQGGVMPRDGCSPRATA